MSNTLGTLYGIGVGPGDPELVPVKSVRIIKEVDIIYTASSTKNDYSMAVNTVKSYIPELTPVITLPFPMTRDKSETETAWTNHARTIIEQIEEGRNVAFLTLGDPTTYSTYGYILQNVRALAPHVPVTTIPGITSYQATAARLNKPLVEGEESLLITSGVQGGNLLRDLSPRPENVVFLKAYRNAGDIATALEETGYIENSVGISRCGLPEEEVIEDVRAFKKRKPGYWTIIMAKQKND
ncbi:precorrin-2 C(20)-methyltransferase [Desulfonema ishimotonii]|uniref:Precorrin-2 C(20)-methyltransferase n=1 Tax=Desulfonema ishimotonii TaxID=45657 RepID=A0A401G496_9BACT|nr:precorrin-2 C(20)-methyltransferase [Desulfonema ishimotonii]GBC64046.1 precorrin-2 C(20)-methyltransferase [Desulfonema ishimotonii]